MVKAPGEDGGRGKVGEVVAMMGIGKKILHVIVDDSGEDIFIDEHME